MNRAFILLGAALAVIQAAAASPPVQVALRSSWSAPPLLAEILETVALENPSVFFEYLEQLTNPEVVPTFIGLSPEATHQAALQVAIDNSLLHEPSALALVQLNLGLHAATPKLEAYYNYYNEHHRNSPGTECGSWVDWYGTVICDVEALASLVKTEAIDAPNPNIPNRPQLLTFDHIFPPPDRVLERPPRTAIFYGSLTSSKFRELYVYLLKLTNTLDPHVEFVFRHIPPSNPSSSRNYLSGYGVALDLKKMDYLALDDRNSNAGSASNPGSTGTDSDTEKDKGDLVLPLILSYPENISVPDASASLTEAERRVLGSHSMQIILDSENKLDTLIQISENFPKYAAQLARRVVVNESLLEEVAENAIRAPRGTNVFWLNGAPIDPKDVTPFGLMKAIRKERSTILSITHADQITRQQAFDVMTDPGVEAAQKANAVAGAIFDASDRPEGGDIIFWWNDMEKDKRYSRWPDTLFSLLRSMYPGQLPIVRKNLFNCILILDLSDRGALNFVANPMANVIERDFPLRFGLVPTPETETGAKMAKLFYYLINEFGKKSTLSFIRSLSAVVVPDPTQRTIEWPTVSDHYNLLVSTHQQQNPDFVPVPLEDVIKGKVERPAPIEKIGDYVDRLGAGLSPTAPMGHAFFNGKHFDFDDDFLRSLQTELSAQTQFLASKVYEMELTDDNHGDTMANYFYDLPTTSKRRNKYIFPSGSAAANIRIVNMPEIFNQLKLKLSSWSYVYPAVKKVGISHSTLIFADLDSDDGLNLVKNALLSLDEDSRTRLSFIHNPSKLPTFDGDNRPTASWLFSYLYTRDLFSKASPSTLLSALGLGGASHVYNQDAAQVPLSSDDAVKILTGGLKIADIPKEEYYDYIHNALMLARRLKVTPGESILIVNGRIVGPIGSDGFQPLDFKALEEFEWKKRTEPVLKAFETVIPDLAHDKYRFADVISSTSSVIAASQQLDPSEIGLFDAPPRPRQRNYKLLESNYTVIKIGDEETALYRIGLLLDHLSETGQKWTSLIKWLRNIPDVFVEIHLNPKGYYDDLPVKRFYRYNLVPALRFDDNGEEVAATALFEDLPVDPIYTLAMDVPSSWLVRPRVALYDLDNIQLNKLFPGDTSVEAIFQLDNIVIEGHARDINIGNAPRGVQLELTSSEGVPIDDTLIVYNLGYFQFKAEPGVFQLKIRPGRSQEIFRLESAGNEGWDSPSVDEAGDVITVTSFEGITLYPRLARLLGKEKEDVLAETDEDDSKSAFEEFTDRFKSMFGSGKKDTQDLVLVKEQADINIFTVASGLLYERFVGIMILSVLRNTNSTVKFWFIENFLSPTFLEFIPHMAEKYNFQYELVTYKWPSWLRAQTEKQRIIWAYKILFLDVLFPLDLKKVIFVDADQIVRADLQELVDLDLEGAPYGYTPMGDDNTDMEGFRFWKTGYWKEFLQGKPYHISALYVIDLVRFRQLAAGDILRGQYQQLSADPNSLANLDQDLPNNLQAQVPIYSLNEDWLWCETWCSKDRLHRAKTIDLCQNPLTKEPKLARARQIPEWEVYDAEIAQLARELAAEGKVHTRMATADANVLAGGGSQNADKPEVAAQVDTETDVPTSPTDASKDQEGRKQTAHDEL
ncbi:glycosyltransferase family 24 protein [Panaeolus papilionaceus]|nr:glycosyltransferase family 24 protein [Panaeolus papilionaceus]